MSTLELTLDKRGGKSLPLYEQIRRRIRQAIEDEELRPGDRLPAIASLVKQWHVDYSTIKAAFELLGEEGVLRLEPRKGAVVTAGPDSRTGTLTMLFIRWGGDALVVDFGEGISRYCAENEHKYVCVDARLDHKTYLDAILHPPEDVDGLVLMPLGSEEYRQAISETIAKGRVVVFVDRILPGLDVSSVTADHFTSGYCETRHLLEYHVQPVYYIGQTETPSSCHDRYRGWMEAMRAHGHHDIDDYTCAMRFKETDSVTYRDPRVVPRQIALELFNSGRPGPYSIVGENDYCAQGIYLAAEEMGLTIGKDVYVVGHSDLPFCSNADPPLTSTYQPREQLGYEAAKLLHKQLRGDIRRPIHRVLPVELHIRASSGVKEEF